MTVLIPAYKPTEALLKLLDGLGQYGFDRILVIDDGCGPDYAHIFEGARERGAVVLTHEVNMGKGRGLKTGFAYVLENTQEDTGVVIADDDGQHIPEDIAAVAQRLKMRQDGIVLGTREFTGSVPLKSRLGNGITRCVYALASGVMIKDTQTGLRGFPVKMLENLLKIKGERFEYEMNMLLTAARERTHFYQQTIQTVYFNNNAQTRFHSLKDPIRIYSHIIYYCLPSIAMFAIDYAVFLILLGVFEFGFGIATLAAAFFAAKAAAYGVRLVFTKGPDSPLVVAVKTALMFLITACAFLLGATPLVAKLTASATVGVLWLVLLTAVSRRGK